MSSDAAKYILAAQELTACTVLAIYIFRVWIIFVLFCTFSINCANTKLKILTFIRKQQMIVLVGVEKKSMKFDSL